MKLSIAGEDGKNVRVALVGQCTQRNLNPLEDPLIQLLGPGGYGKLVRLDLSEVSYLDSSGVGWLLACQKRMQQAGGRLTLERPHPMVVNVLRVLKLEKLFELPEVNPGEPASSQPGAAT
jgi:anti-sigma B factor antagonist